MTTENRRLVYSNTAEFRVDVYYADNLYANIVATFYGKTAETDAKAFIASVNVTLNKFSDVEIEREYYSRALKKLGDPCQGVSL